MFVPRNENRPFAPYLTDDGKAVSIITDQDHPESYLLFTNEAMDRFAKILAEVLSFNKEYNFYLDWKDGQFVYGWKWDFVGEIAKSDIKPTFGEILEDIIFEFNRIWLVGETPEEGLGVPQPYWECHPSEFAMSRIPGYLIYQRLVDVCSSLIEENNVSWDKDNENVFDVLNGIVQIEDASQNGIVKKSIGGDVIYPPKKEKDPCDDPLVLGGLCLLWHSNFFDFFDIGDMSREDLQDKRLLERCGGISCEFLLDGEIWGSETTVGDFMQKGGFMRGLITKNCCYCGKIRLEALRTPSNVEIKDALNKAQIVVSDDGPWTTVCTTDDTMPRPTKKDSKKDHRAPIIGPGNEFDYGRFEGRYEPDLSYRHDVLVGLLFSIFNGRRNYSVDESDPEYGKRNPHIKRDLPLPEADIRFLADKKIQASEERRYYLVYGDHLPEPEFDKKDLARRRAAKHRLGRKITEIGQFLQWWNDLPIDELFSYFEEYETEGGEIESMKVYEKPLRVLREGIMNVRDKL